MVTEAMVTVEGIPTMEDMGVAITEMVMVDILMVVLIMATDMLLRIHIVTFTGKEDMI